MADAFSERLRLAADQLTPERRLLHLLDLMGGAAVFGLSDAPGGHARDLLLAAQTLVQQGLAARVPDGDDLALVITSRGYAALNPRLTADHPQGVHHA